VSAGNPKGRKPKHPSDHAGEFKQIVDKKIKVKDGGKERTITKRTVTFKPKRRTSWEKAPMEKKTPERRQSPVDDEEEIRRIRLRFQQGLRAGMTNPQATAYANAPKCVPGGDLGVLGPEAPTLRDCAAAQSSSGEGNESVTAPLSPNTPPLGLSENIGHGENTDAEPQIDSDCGASQALLMQNSSASSESDPSSRANDEGCPQQNVSATAQSSKHKVGPARLPNGRWPRNVSGNPGGRKPKNPSNHVDQPSEFEKALDKTVKVKDGNKARTLTKRAIILENWSNSAAKGNLGALRLLIAYADKRGIDLFAGQHEAIQKAFAEAARSPSAFIVTEEVLERLSKRTLDELKRGVQEVEAEKKKKMH
jgi:Family of unknown function (DUF5681)